MRKPQLHLVAPVALLLGSVAVACGSVEPGPEADVLHAAPAGEYVVTAVTDGGTPRPLVKGSEIRFSFDDGNLGIRAGCNSMSGAYAVEGTRLTVRGIGGTDMGCSQPLMDQDAWVAGLFDEPVRLTLGTDAAIVAGDVVLALKPREDVHPDQPLVGTQWRLDGTFDASTASSAGLGVLVIAPDGRSATISERCRETRATTSISGDEIRWSDARTVEHSCPAQTEDGQDREVAEAVRDLLAGPVRATVAEDSLTLTLASGDRGLTFRAAR